MTDSELPALPAHDSRSPVSPPLWLLLVIGVACGLAGPFLAEHLTQAPNGARLAYLTIAAAAVAVVLAELQVYGMIGLFSPLSATMAGFLWFFCAGPIFKPEMNPYLYARASDYLPLVLAIALGLACFLVGYLAAPRFAANRLMARLGRLDRDLNPHNLLLLQVSVLALLIGLLAGTALLIGVNPLRFLTESMYGTATAPRLAVASPVARYPYLLHRSVLIALCGLSALIISCRDSTRFAKGIALAGFLLASALAAARGSRFILLYAAGGGLLLLLLRSLPERRPASSGPAWRLALLALPAFVALGFVGLQLVEWRRGGSPLEKLSGGLASPYDLIDYGADMNRTLNASFEMVPDQQPYLLGETYLSVVTLFVPRAWWPSKPEALSSYLFEASGAVVPNVSFSNLGELYANFGWLGITLGMWLTGVILSVCWTTFLENRHNRVAVLFYSMIPFTAAFMVRGAFSTAVGATLYAGLLSYAGLSLFTRSWPIPRNR